MAKVKIRGRFYVVVTVVAAVILLLIVILLNGRKEGTVAAGAVQMEIQAEGVVIRDEVCITTEKYDRVIFAVGEGELVEENTPVAQVFKLGYNDDVMQNLLDVQKQILTLQLEQLSGIENQQLNELNDQINAVLGQIRQRALNDTQENLLNLELTLKDLMSQRRTYLKETVQATEQLTQLYQEEQAKTAQLDVYRSSIVSAQAGRISFYFDGYEQALNEAKLSMLSGDLVTSALKGASVSSASAITENLLYRVVDDSHFYIAYTSKASSPERLVAGETYQVMLDGDSSKVYTATAMEPVVGNSVVNLLEFSQPIGYLLDVRGVSLTITKSASGITVPVDAISISKEHLPGITLEVGKEQQWIQVDVLAMDEEQAVIRAANTGEVVAAGQKYIKP